MGPCSSTVKFSLVQFSFQLFLALISIMRPISIHLAKGCYRQDPKTLPCQKCSSKNAFWQMQCQGTPLTGAYTFQCMETLNQIYLEQTGLQASRNQKASCFCPKDAFTQAMLGQQSGLLMYGKGSGEWWLLPANTRESNKNQPRKHHCRMRKKCKCLQKHIEQIVTSLLVQVNTYGAQRCWGPLALARQRGNTLH